MKWVIRGVVVLLMATAMVKIYNSAAAKESPRYYACEDTKERRCI